jgi:hypothetical protein
LRKLVIILIALIAVATFIRAIDLSGTMNMDVSAGLSETNSETIAE